MRVSSRLFRASVWLASTSLSLSSIMPAAAQPTPPPPDQSSEQPDAGAPAGDPPAIAGRVSVVSGTVSFHASGDTTWNPATLNYPVTNGDGFWTEPSAHAEIQVGDDRVVLAGSTEFEIGALDAGKIAATQAQGAIFLQIQSLPNGQTLAIDTPRGEVQIGTPGRYEVVAGDTNDATTVTVVEGAAHVQGNGVSLDIGPQQTATIGGTDTFDGNVGAMQQDEFLQTELRQAQQAQQRVSSLPQQVQYMTGGSELAQYGSFQTSAQYGQVWYPRDVPADWAPYRDGHWVYVAPWGWNWVDDQPWGFAPSHYGRWVQDGGRWGWCAGVPGEGGGYDDGGGYGGGGYGGGYPVYSPALVAFGGIGAAVLTGAAIGFAVGAFGHGGGIGWVPLGYNEPYYPPYHVSNGYFRNVNRYSVTNIRNYSVTNIRNVTFNNYHNARFATVMPEGAMARGERVGRFGRPLPASAFGNVRSFAGREPLRPTAETPNLSREAARRFNVPVRTEGRGAPGPAIQARAVGERGHGPALRNAPLPGNVRAVPAASVIGNRAGRPGEIAHPGEARPGEVRPGEGRPGEGRPGEPGHPGAPGPRIGEHGGGLPALRAPGAGRPATATPAIRPEGARPGEPGRGGEAGRPAEGRAGEPGRAGEQNRAGPVPRMEGNGRPGNAPGPHAGEHPGGTPAPHGPEAGRPDAAHPGAVRPEPVRPEVGHPAAQAHEPARAPQPAVHGPDRPVQHAAPRAAPAPRAEAPRAEPRRAEPQRAEPARQAPRMAAPRPEAPRPAPRMEAPRPAPHPQAAPRPAPHAEAPHPAPHQGGGGHDKH